MVGIEFVADGKEETAKAETSAMHEKFIDNEIWLHKRNSIEAFFSKISSKHKKLFTPIN